MQWTIKAAAKELGIHKDTLAKGLIRAGLVVERGSKFTTLEIFRGFQGDLKTEQTRKTRAEADRLELEMQVEQGKLIYTENAKKICLGIFAMLRNDISTLHKRVGARGNPTDPELNESAIQEETTNILAKASGMFDSMFPKPISGTLETKKET